MQRASQLCLTPCTTTNGGNPFWVSGTAAQGNGAGAGTVFPNCPNNFLLIANGIDSVAANGAGDRFCGTFLAALSTGKATQSSTVCSKLGIPFHLFNTIYIYWLNQLSNELNTINNSQDQAVQDHF